MVVYIGNSTNMALNWELKSFSITLGLEFMGFSDVGFRGLGFIGFRGLGILAFRVDRV